jgi:hypothetical protein
LIDELPSGPEWHCEGFELEGNRLDKKGKPMVEKLELWRRDPVAVIRELLGNPLFAEHFMAAPEKVFSDANMEEPMIDETWTADWWWKLQVCETSQCIDIVLMNA